MYSYESSSYGDELIQNSLTCLAQITPFQMYQHQKYYLRYRRLIGLSPKQSQAEISQYQPDSLKYKHLIPTVNNGAILNYDLCAEFMSRVSGAPLHECYSYIYLNA